MIQKLASFVVILCVAAVGFSSAAMAGQLEKALIYHAYFSSAVEVINLLDKGADPNAKDEHGWTALAIAADRADIQSTAIAHALIAKGAKVNEAVGRNYPLMNAIKNKNAPLVSILLQNKVNLAIADEKGNTPLALAKKMKNPTVIYYLEKRIFELAQLQAYLYSKEHLYQINQRFVTANCEYQYLSFYLKSEQDSAMDKTAITKRINKTASIISKSAAEGARYFPTYQGGNANTFGGNIRNAIFTELNGMISNKNRRENGVGTMKDMRKRCGKILAQVNK